MRGDTLGWSSTAETTDNPVLSAFYCEFRPSAVGTEFVQSSETITHLCQKPKEGLARKRLDSAPVQETYITQLRANFGTESLPEVNATTLPIRFGFHSPYSSTSSGFGFGGIFIKSALSLLTTANISIPSETEVLVDEQSTWVYRKATRQLSWSCTKALQKMASYAKV